MGTAASAFAVTIQTAASSFAATVQASSAASGAGGGGGGFMALFNANGNAFDRGVSMFASGDVFNSPTAFGFGGGRMGVMGEAGPEAVMPLTRLPGGKLGVQSSRWKWRKRHAK